MFNIIMISIMISIVCMIIVIVNMHRAYRAAYARRRPSARLGYAQSAY